MPGDSRARGVGRRFRPLPGVVVASRGNGRAGDVGPGSRWWHGRNVRRCHLVVPGARPCGGPGTGARTHGGGGSRVVELIIRRRSRVGYLHRYHMGRRISVRRSRRSREPHRGRWSRDDRVRDQRCSRHGWRTSTRDGVRWRYHLDPHLGPRCLTVRCDGSGERRVSDRTFRAHDRDGRGIRAGARTVR